MGSRQSLQYNQLPIPSEPEQLPVFLNDELLKMGTLLNSLLEGSVFPPASVLPKRTVDGMVKFFVGNLGTGVTTTGLYIFYGKSWHPIKTF